MRNKLKSNKAITLIALIITIIVMLILVGVVVSVVINSNLLETARTAGEKMNIDKEKEAIALAWSSMTIGKYVDDQEITAELFEETLRKEGNDTAVSEDEEGFLIYFRETNRSYKVDNIGHIIEDSNNVYKGKYTIANMSELQRFRDEVNAGTFSGAENDNTAYLIADIDMSSETNWTPIGNKQEKAFTGTFVGNNHKINNLSINATEYGVGLFGYNNGSITDITILSGNIVSSGERVGAICGVNYGNIENCKNYAYIIGYADIGGITGQCVGGEVIKCSNYSKIEGTNRWTGGIVGSLYNNGSVSECLNAGDIKCTGTGGCTGGIVGGTSQNGATISNCYNFGNIEGIFFVRRNNWRSQ